MKSCGIIAEYNPFHKGHRYQIEEAKKKTSADVMIVVMSGNFLQRGEPAIVDKWKRAEMALASGADIVIELPVAFSVQPADYFAKGGVALLQEMKCDVLSFGTESGTAEEFQQFAADWLKNEKQIEAAFQQFKNNGDTYSEQMQQAAESVLSKHSLDLQLPNTILGLAYAKENSRYRHPMLLEPIQRLGAGYHEKQLQNKSFQSATAIRKQLLEQQISGQISNADKQALKAAVPAKVFNILEDSQLVDWNAFWPFLKYQLIVQSEEQLRQMYQMNEGIEYRLKEFVTQAENFEHFVELVKTKRYTWVRLQRLFTYVLLQFTKDIADEALDGPKAIRVLGFSAVGQQYLSQIKKSVSIPIISRLHQKNKDLWEIDIQAGKIYQLATGEVTKEQDFHRLPLRKVEA